MIHPSNIHLSLGFPTHLVHVVKPLQLCGALLEQAKGLLQLPSASEAHNIASTFKTGDINWVIPTGGGMAR